MTKNTDKYKDLENISSQDTASFYNEWNSRTDAYFGDSVIDSIAGQLSEISNADVKGLPRKYGKYTFWAERKSDWQKVKIMCQKKGDEPHVLLDFEDSEEALDYWYPSDDGRKLVYGTSTSGNEQVTLKIMDVVNETKLVEEIPFAGYTDQGSICWVSGSSFIYPRMNGFSKYGSEDKWLLGTKLYLHKIGDEPSSDKLIYGKESPDTVMMVPTLSSDKTKLYVAECRDELTHQVYIVDLLTSAITQINSSEPASFVVKAGKGKVYVLTNFEAPRYRLLMCEEDDIELDFALWDEVLPESTDILQDFWIHSTTSILAQFSHNVTSRLNIYDAYGNQTDIIHLPKYSVVQDVVCTPTSPSILYSLSSYVLPTTHYLVETTSSAPLLVWQREPLIGDDLIEITQEWAESKDGTKIPYFFVRKKDTVKSPCIIYGYGGFNISIEPSYLTSMRPWVLAGGSVAIANLRGGSEFGEAWHKGGSMANKQNTFDDCIAIGEHLITQGQTTKEMLGVMGGSNGGLLVSAVTVQRPDLFRAGASLVPLTDMLEFYKHQVAEFWVHEYGDPRITEQRAWIEQWSPYHYPIDVSVSYPALYYETALHDARVSPLHAFKMVARLDDEVRQWKGPLLLRTMTDTGHQSSNLTKADLARRTAEYYAFFAKELGLTISKA